MKNTAMSVLGQEVLCQIERKAIRHVYLRIRPDGSILLSIPLSMKEESALAFAKTKEKWLAKKLAEIHAAEKRKQNLQDNRQIKLLGKVLPLVIVTGRKTELVLKDDTALLTLSARADTVTALHHCMMQELKKEVLKLRQTHDQYLISHAQTLPDITCRRMKSRWGTCTPSKNKIVLNTALAACHPDLIDAVLWHEYAHLFVRGHTAQFYELVTSRMPDYKKRRTLLKREEITL